MRQYALKACLLLILFTLSACGDNATDTRQTDNSRSYQPSAGGTLDTSKGEYGPTSFLKADCVAIANAFDQAEGVGFCEELFGQLNQAPPFSLQDCIEQGSQLDAERAEGFCHFIFPALGYSSLSPVIGPNHYVEMPDGTLIAVNIKLPANYQPGKRYPTVVEMSGYESGSSDGSTVAGDMYAATGIPFPLQGGTRAAHGKYYEDSYVSIVASVRGTGCSSGEFDLFSDVSAWDGYHLIEWAAAQDWSNGDVGLFGHSYSGITATMIAARQPPHLRVLSSSGLIGDLYRDTVYPGGVSNYGFPVLWTGAVRVAYDVLGGSLAGWLADNGDRQCLRNQAARSRTVMQDPILNGIQDWDGAWFRSRSVVNLVDQIKVPTHITHSYQDEQVGPRGAPNVYDHLSSDIPRRLVLLNGNHDSQSQTVETIAERKAWLDYWLLGKPNPFVNPTEQTESVRVLLEVTTKHAEGPERSNGEINSSDFPLPETRWTNYYLQGGATVGTDKPTEEASHTTYFHGSHRQFYIYQAGVNSFGEITSVNGPDEAMFTSAPLEEDMVIAGPVTAKLFMQALPAENPLPLPVPVDFEIQIQLLDIGPDGAHTYLQRGLLRAAHRAIDPLRSDYTSEGEIYRPFRPHDGPVPDFIQADKVYEYLVEIFPVGHVFRAGHQLAVKIHSPALDDNDWIYFTKSAPAIASLHHSAEKPSHIRLPVIPLSEVEDLGEGYGACASARVRCVYPGGGGGEADAPEEPGEEAGLLCAPNEVPGIGGECAPVDPNAGTPF